MRNDMDPYQKAIEDRIRETQRYRRWLRRSPFSEMSRSFLWKMFANEAGALNRVRNRARRELRVESRGDHFVGVGR